MEIGIEIKGIKAGRYHAGMSDEARNKMQEDFLYDDISVMVAIRKMMSLAKADDVLVIAGKGGEKYQIIGNEKRDYNDFDAVYKVIQQNKTKMKEEYGN